MGLLQQQTRSFHISTPANGWSYEQTQKNLCFKNIDQETLPNIINESQLGSEKTNINRLFSHTPFGGITLIYQTILGNIKHI